jgi:hypothetical protein
VSANGVDFCTIDDLSQRLRLSPKVIKRLHKDLGFPIWRLTPHGPFYGFWSEIEKWLHDRRRRLASSGQIRS